MRETWRQGGGATSRRPEQKSNDEAVFRCQPNNMNLMNTPVSLSTGNAEEDSRRSGGGGGGAAMKRERERERERQTDRQTDRQTETETERNRERQR